MDLDKKRIAAVRALEALGCSYRNNEWVSQDALGAMLLPQTFEADAIHGALMRRADAPADCTESSEEEAELENPILLSSS
jgi:hypothetical protein